MDPLEQLGEALASETKVTISGLWPVYKQLKLNLNKTENIIHNSIHSANLETDSDSDSDSVQLFTTLKTFILIKIARRIFYFFFLK